MRANGPSDHLAILRHPKLGVGLGVVGGAGVIVASWVANGTGVGIRRNGVAVAIGTGVGEGSCVGVG